MFDVQVFKSTLLFSCLVPFLMGDNYVEKYNRANERPKFAMLATNFGYRYSTDDWLRLEWWLRAYIGCYIGPKKLY